MPTIHHASSCRHLVYKTKIEIDQNESWEIHISQWLRYVTWKDNYLQMLWWTFLNRGGKLIKSSFKLHCHFYQIIMKLFSRIQYDIIIVDLFHNFLQTTNQCVQPPYQKIPENIPRASILISKDSNWLQQFIWRRTQENLWVFL